MCCCKRSEAIDMWVSLMATRYCLSSFSPLDSHAPVREGCVSNSCRGRQTCRRICHGVCRRSPLLVPSADAFSLPEPERVDPSVRRALFLLHFLQNAKC